MTYRRRKNRIQQFCLARGRLWQLRKKLTLPYSAHSVTCKTNFWIYTQQQEKQKKGLSAIGSIHKTLAFSTLMTISTALHIRENQIQEFSFWNQNVNISRTSTNRNRRRILNRGGNWQLKIKLTLRYSASLPQLPDPNLKPFFLKIGHKQWSN